jgi:hypothetical protein
MLRDRALHSEKCSFSMYGLFNVDQSLIAVVGVYIIMKNSVLH